MKPSTFLLIFIVALFCLFSLQVFWLYHLYHLSLRKTEESISSIFQKAIEKELDCRFLDLEKRITQNLPETNLPVDSFKINSEYVKEEGIISQQFVMIQQLMKDYGIPFRVDQFDSIFHSLLLLHNFSFDYQLHYLNSVGESIEVIGHPIHNGFATVALPILDGEKIQATVEISMPGIFKNMLSILSVSILIFLFIIACLIYEIKIILNQHHINQLRKNFIQALTHNLISPLATIYSSLNQLSKGSVEKNCTMEERKFIAIAIEQTFNIQVIVDQILTHANAEKEQLSLNRQPINLPLMIQSLMDNFIVQGVKNIEFESSYNLGDVIVYADSFYLSNAISNLIDNAIKYSGASVKIKIECTIHNEQIYIQVKDNGFGISSKDQQKIFNLFERGAEIKRNRIKGFGIGLNYVQHVIKAHGGTIKIVSQEGIGSEFTIVFPNLKIGLEE